MPGLKCSFCPKVDPAWLCHDGFVCCVECYTLLVIRFEFQPITKETDNGR